MKILIYGGSGLVGSAIKRYFSPDDQRLLAPEGFAPSHEVYTPTHGEVDVMLWDRVYANIRDVSPDLIVMAAGMVGGIKANQEDPFRFLTVNAMMALNVIGAAGRLQVPRLIYFGSSCLYPKKAPQPFRPDTLLRGAFEPTNEGYALGKMLGVKSCEYLSRQYPSNFRYTTLMPCNVYGPGDNYNPETSHVLAALVHKFVKAKEQGERVIRLWGNGTARREFIHSDDLARAVGYILSDNACPPIVNAGTGQEVTIQDLALRIAYEVDFRGQIVWDSKEVGNGMERKVMDSSVLRDLGWSPSVDLMDHGVSLAVDAYKRELEHGTVKGA